MKKTLGLIMIIGALTLATGCSALTTATGTGTDNTTGQAITVQPTVATATAIEVKPLSETQVVYKEIEKVQWKPVHLTLDELNILKNMKPKKNYIVYVTKQNIKLDEQEFPLNKVLALKELIKGKKDSQVLDKTFTVIKYQKENQIKFIYQYEDKNIKFNQQEFTTVKELVAEIEKTLM